MDPKCALFYYNRGLVNNLLGRKAEARQDYSKAVELDPNYDAKCGNREALLVGVAAFEAAIPESSSEIPTNSASADDY